MTLAKWQSAGFSLAAEIQPHELRAVGLAFVCNFLLLGSYYILRPVRDAMATVFGVENLQNLYTGTLVFTLLCAPVYAWLASKIKLTRFLPGVFWFWIANIVLFYALFETMPQSRALAAAFYWWFSVVNLFMISMFWSLLVDLFSATQATRLFALIAAGGSLGAIAGPAITSVFVRAIGISGMLLVAAAGFVLVVLLVYALIREKDRVQAATADAQDSKLDRPLPGKPLDGFKTLLKSPYLIYQTLFFMLMTWAATVAYFLQTDVIAKSVAGIEGRTEALADIDLVVNIISALVLIFGLGRFVTRFGLKAGLSLNPLLMIPAFAVVALAPTLFMVQALQVIRRAGQYAVVRPCREVCFTILNQESRYKAKSVIDTVVYRFGDLTAAWVQAGLLAAGFGLAGTISVGIAASGAWLVVALLLGRRYENLRAGNMEDPAVAREFASQGTSTPAKIERS